PPGRAARGSVGSAAPAGRRRRRRPGWCAGSSCVSAGRRQSVAVRESSSLLQGLDRALEQVCATTGKSATPTIHTTPPLGKSGGSAAAVGETVGSRKEKGIVRAATRVSLPQSGLVQHLLRILLSQMARQVKIILPRFSESPAEGTTAQF